MMKDVWKAPPGFRPTKSAPSSPAKPLGILSYRSESFHSIHKVPVGDTPYVRAKNVQLLEKDPERAIPLFWAAINAGDRVDSALKDMAIVMKQQNRAEEAIEAIKSLRIRCSDQAQESLDNILLDLYKRSGRLDDQIKLLKHKLFLVQKGLAFNGKSKKIARSQGKKFQVSVEQEATRLLGNLGWALMQKENYVEAEDAYRQALSIAPDKNKICNLGICLMKQGRMAEAKEILRRVKPAVADGPRGVHSHLKAYEMAQQMLNDLISEMMNKGEETRIQHSRLFESLFGSSSVWQPQPCKDQNTIIRSNDQNYADENVNSNLVRNQVRPPPSERSVKQVMANSDYQGNSLNIDAPPFFSSKFMKNPVLKDPIVDHFQFQETPKRTRCGNVANNRMIMALSEAERPETKVRRNILSEENGDDKIADLVLPDNKDLEEAILAAVLGPSNYEGKRNETGIFLRKLEKRLKAFQDITLSSSPRA